MIEYPLLAVYKEQGGEGGKDRKTKEKEKLATIRNMGILMEGRQKCIL